MCVALLAGFVFSVPAWSQPGTRRESIEVNKSSKLSCFLCCTKDTKGGRENLKKKEKKKALKCFSAKECRPSRFKVATDFQNPAWKGGIGEGEDLWINYTVDLSVKISELSGGQSHMLRINGCSGPLILHPLFSALDKLDFGDGKVARPFVSLDRFGAIHYAAGWGKVSMWPDRPVFPALHSCWERPTLSHSHCSLQTQDRSPLLLPHPRATLLHSITSARTHTHTHIPPLPAPSLEKPGSKTPRRHFEGVYRPVLSLSLLPPSPLPPPPRTLSHSILISLHGSDLTPHHASHPGVHHDQRVHGLQHPCRTPDRTRTGDLQTREILVGSKGGWTQEKGKSATVLTCLT